MVERTSEDPVFANSVGARLFPAVAEPSRLISMVSPIASKLDFVRLIGKEVSPPSLL